MTAEEIEKEKKANASKKRKAETSAEGAWLLAMHNMIVKAVVLRSHLGSFSLFYERWMKSSWANTSVVILMNGTQTNLLQRKLRLVTRRTTKKKKRDKKRKKSKRRKRKRRKRSEKKNKRRKNNRKNKLVPHLKNQIPTKNVSLWNIMAWLACLYSKIISVVVVHHRK